MARTSPHVAAPVRLDWIALALRAGLGLVLLVGGWNKLSHLIDPARRRGARRPLLGPAGVHQRFLRPISICRRARRMDLAVAVPDRTILDRAGERHRPHRRPPGAAARSRLGPAAVDLRDRDPGRHRSGRGGRGPDLHLARPAGAGARRGALGDDVRALQPRCRLGQLGRTPLWLAARARTDWNNLGLLLRLSLALPLLVGGAFAGLDHIQSFAATPWLLVPLGVLIAAGAGGVSGRAASLATALVMLWFMATRVSLDATLIANLNAFKREFALLAAAGVLAYAGGGARFSWRGAVSALRPPSPATARAPRPARARGRR